MADTKITGLTQGVPVGTDVLPYVSDPSGTPVTKKTLWDNGGWYGGYGTWSYASATTITVPSGATSLYQVGDKIKLTQTTVKYFYITAVANTLLTVTGGSDYTVANAAITLPFYSHSSSPLGFPQNFNYTPTGISATNSTKTGRFAIIGRRVFCDIKVLFTGAITFTTMPSLPVAASASFLSNDVYPVGTAGYKDSGTAYVLDTLFPSVIASATVVTVNGPTGSAAPISATSPITWANGDELALHFIYEI